MAIATIKGAAITINGERIETETVRVTWEESRTIDILFVRCNVCATSTPRPTNEELVAVVKRGRAEMCAGTDWVPAGWSPDPVHGLLCPECTAVKNKALDARRKKR